MLVVVLPSPAGVGLMAVTRTSLPVGAPCEPPVKVQRNLGLGLAEKLQVLFLDADLGGDRLNGQQLGVLRNSYRAESGRVHAWPGACGRG